MISNKRKIILDGNNFNNLEEFYTEIYRIMPNKPDWQPAHNLDALNDVMYDGFGKEPIVLMWKNVEKSKDDLGLEATVKFYERKIETGPPFNIQWAKQQIAELKHGHGQTLFQIFVEIIQTQKHILLKMK
ncbi:MAG: barstar family protein [Saprospiraceae bacterium]